MSKFPLISVIVPTYNSGRYVGDAVASVLAQTYPNIELIVVDDGSTDDTRSRLQNNGGRLRYIYQANGGVSSARNVGISHARGRMIAFLDADDQWRPEKLAMQWACMKESSAPLVHTAIEKWHEASGKYIRDLPDRSLYSGYCYERFFFGNGVVTSSVLVVRECLEAAGGFDESKECVVAEDLDLWIRLARNHKFAYVDKPLVIYRVHDANSSGNLARMARSEFYVYDRALRVDKTLRERLGAKHVRSVMSDLAFGAGYASAIKGNLREARRYFAHAARYKGLSPRIWLFWGCTFLTQRQFELSRQLKGKISSIRAMHGSARGVDN